MKNFFENLIAGPWNRHAAARAETRPLGAVLDVGARVVDGEPVRARAGVAENRRAESIALIGKSGTGKTSLFRKFQVQDVHDLNFFAEADLHGEEMPFLLKTIALQERKLRRDLSDRVIAIDPSDPDSSVGLNPLEAQPGVDRFAQVAEFSEILKQRWHLDGFGARTDELLRNALYALSENGYTLIELAPLLSDGRFRSACVARVTHSDVREYFEQRYDQLSDAMRRTMSEPVLNKVSFFVSDARFRHLVGQRRSTFSLTDAMDRGAWIILNLDKGKLGEPAATFGSLFLASFKHAFFARKRRGLFTLYCDEVQNLVAFGGGLETMLAEIRKRAGSIVTANQYLAQLTAETQAAILSVGTFGFFQLSAADAQQIAGMLDGGKSLGERLKNLPRRHLILKTADERWCEAVVPTVTAPDIDASDLYRRSIARWARPRRVIEEEIRSRRQAARPQAREALDAWD
jgi:hypothetical protein